MSIELVIADPYPAMLDGMAHAFAKEPDLLIKACVNDGDAALQAVLDLSPDVIVLDLELPQKDGLTLLGEMQALNLKTRSVLFSSSPSSEVVAAIRLGVQGVVTKDMSLQLLVHCIREVHAGKKWIEKSVAAGAVNYLLKRESGQLFIKDLLTPREIAVARMVSEGLPNKRIASRLSISEGTAKLHLHRVYQKLQLRGRMELMNYMQKVELK